ncbi:MAG: tRNA pseudouridine(55) synthase TruB [Oscillospiraceae bacterium]|nr:tRNA pseudouridine(55) synthase TruB [Oscillospiraceae bacterium]
MTGFVIVDKPAGMTSFGVVAKIRGMSGIKKVGHAGTLDPDATGVLPVFLGGATRFIDLLPEHDKRYTATLLLGQTTDTQDTTGTVLRTRPIAAGKDQVERALAGFVGKQKQIPPMYSAVKQDGKRLYQLARAGVEVERPARNVEIHEINLLEWDEPVGRYIIDVRCSKGTYIRTLCHDLGERLGCGGVMENLRRTSACGYSLQGALTLDALQVLTDQGRFEEALMSICLPFTHLPELVLDERCARLFGNGVRLELSYPGVRSGQRPYVDGDRVAVFGPSPEDYGYNFLGLAIANKGLLWHLRLLT